MNEWNSEEHPRDEKMIKALNNGVKTEQDILLCLIYIKRNMEIEYKKSIDIYL